MHEIDQLFNLTNGINKDPEPSKVVPMSRTF